jgi:fructosamine-3-kinase
MVRITPSYSLAQQVMVEQADNGKVWLAELADLTTTYLEKWALTPLSNLGNGCCSQLLLVRDREGKSKVLKFTLPAKAQTEFKALEYWRESEITIKPYRYDIEKGVILLELAHPFQKSHQLPFILGDLLATLHQYPSPSFFLPTYADFFKNKINLLLEYFQTKENKEEQELCLIADQMLNELISTEGSKFTLLHSDIKPEHILKIKERIITIDPSPILGPCELDVGITAVKNDWGVRIFERCNKLANLLDYNSERVITFARFYALTRALNHQRGKRSNRQYHQTLLDFSFNK